MSQQPTRDDATPVPAATLRDWARLIDEGPFSSLCWGERIAFDNPDSLTLLGAGLMGCEYWSPETVT